MTSITGGVGGRGGGGLWDRGHWGRGLGGGRTNSLPDFFQQLLLLALPQNHTYHLARNLVDPPVEAGLVSGGGGGKAVSSLSVALAMLGKVAEDGADQFRQSAEKAILLSGGVFGHPGEARQNGVLGFLRLKHRSRSVDIAGENFPPFCRGLTFFAAAGVGEL